MFNKHSNLNPMLQQPRTVAAVLCSCWDVKHNFLLGSRVQRIARRGKKGFLSDQCKEREENNRMGKTRELFKKIRDSKGNFHVKMGTIKYRNGMDLTEAEDIKTRWQECTEELYKKRSS